MSEVDHWSQKERQPVRSLLAAGKLSYQFQHFKTWFVDVVLSHLVTYLHDSKMVKKKNAIHNSLKAKLNHSNGLFC